MREEKVVEIEELRRLVEDVQRHRMEPSAIEAKAASSTRGTPDVKDSLSSFANRNGGGVILFGLDEEQDFAAVGVADLQRAQEDVTSWARDVMVPPVTLEFTVGEIDGKPVMAIEVEELPVIQKPCYNRNRGLNGGSYIRTGGTDRRMTDYEVFTYVSARGQPREDEQLVSDASVADLSSNLLDVYFDTLRITAKSRLLEKGRDDALVSLRICGLDDPVLRPTLGGLLMFGKYPQEFFPQLRITFVQFYGVTEDERTPTGARFLDNQSFEGPIPEMLERTMNHVLGAMRKSSLIEGVVRKELPEYPQEAIREALANAVAHRDYSSSVRGSYVKVSMFADRLEIQSPGGLFGNVTLDNIEDEHSTRNSRLMRMMEDMRVVENRGSGINAMLHALREANLEPPGFDDRRVSFEVTFRNHTLMSRDAISWLSQFASTPLNDRQRLALVYLRQHGQITNSDYRRLNRVDMNTAGAELRGLVETGMTEQEGVGRWTNYRLAVSPELPEQREPQTEEDRIVVQVRETGSITNTQCRKLLAVDENRAYYLLKLLCDGGRLVPKGRGKGRRYELS